MTLPMGFKVRAVLLPALLIACMQLLAVDLRVTSGATPAFSTNRDVRCITTVFPLIMARGAKTNF